MTTEIFFSEQHEQQMRIQALESLIAKKDERIAFYEQEVEHLKEMILGLKRQAFGPRKERWLE